jgi:hypothetical protein
MSATPKTARVEWAGPPALAPVFSCLRPVSEGAIGDSGKRPWIEDLEKIAKFDEQTIGSENHPT